MPDMNMQTFEELQRHQLVTEFDIQSQSELVDYQVKLDNVSNPTQAQDNLVVGVDGESLPHWNESVDFDIWVKMQIATSGKRGLLIHGNGLSNESSGDDVFAFFDDFSSDLSKWTLTQSTAGNVQIVSNELRITGNGVWNANGAATGYNVDMPIIIEFDKKASIASDQNNFYGYSSQPLSYLTGVLMQDDSSNTLKRWIDGVSSSIGTYSTAWEHIKIILDSSNYYLYRGGSLLSSGAYTTDGYKITFQQYNANYFYVDNVLARKYTATEPTYTIGTPKNISTALKSFGRAG